MKRVDAALGGAAVLFAAYLLTMAPDVTFWDAGEFIAAAHSLGIPHPPGTPLFVLLENVWARLLFVLPYAAATNLFSAAATALAAWLTGRIVWRAMQRRNAAEAGSMAFASAVAAGGMSSVWLNATETEVYAASLALGVVTIWAAERAGRAADDRWTLLTAYLIALAVPLHLSALVVAPVAILLASYDATRVHWRRVAVLGGTFIGAMGVGRVSPVLMAAGAVLVLASMGVRGDPPVQPASSRAAFALGALVVGGIAVSVLAFLYIRSHYDPAINQGDPRTLAALADVVSRRQYAVSPMWPREAPPWLQVANLGQYADWQVALSLGPTVLPSVARTIGTVLFLWLGFIGLAELWRRDRRIALGVLTLFGCGTVGVLAYLNLHAGPSIGFGFLQPTLVREARERDYFFVFGFWAWGVWAGIGAVSLLARWERPAWTGALVACLPLALNWRAVTRRADPEQRLPRVFAEALLESAPRDAVLFVAGDNDTYPVWYAQEVLGLRRDVTLVTVPLLPTRWYRAEIARRHGLLTGGEVDRFTGTLAAAADVAAGSRRKRRRVAVSISMTPRERERLGTAWVPNGLVFLQGTEPDTVAAARWARWVETHLPRGDVRPAIDPVNAYFRTLLDCPRQLLDASRGRDPAGRLDSACNYR